MAAAFIPAGRTSLVKRGGVSLQIQTEYASNPMPRITTTILQEGQVLHKIQRSLDSPISSVEEQNRIEVTIRRQHHEIISILKESKSGRSVGVKETFKAEEQSLDALDSLKSIPGVRFVYRLDNQGNFVGMRTSEHFRQSFAPLMKNLQELLEIFVRVPGVEFTRERGVYEIEVDRLFLVSVGRECLFVVIEPKSDVLSYEDEIRQAVLVER